MSEDHSKALEMQARKKMSASGQCKLKGGYLNVNRRK